MILVLLLSCIVHAYPSIPTAIPQYDIPIPLATQSPSPAALNKASAKLEMRSETRSQLRNVRSDASQTWLRGLAALRREGEKVPWARSWCRRRGGFGRRSSSRRLGWGRSPLGEEGNPRGGC